MAAPRSSLLDYLTDLFQTIPPGLDIHNPSILSLAYYPLRIALSEWTLYTLLMSGYVKYYEYTFSNVNQRISNTENRDFTELHRWRRRSKQSLYRLQLISGFISHWRESAPPTKEVDQLFQDIDHVRDLIKTYAASLEAKGAIITSMIQILDSRRSTEEAVNITHLTHIALVFIPLSFTSTLFSMGADYMPGSNHFWVYLATALPMTLLLIALSILLRHYQIPWKLSLMNCKWRMKSQNLQKVPV